MKIPLAKVFLFLFQLHIKESTQIELDLMREAETYNTFQPEISIVGISRIVEIRDQLNVFDKLNLKLETNDGLHIKGWPQDELKESLGLSHETVSGSNRGAFVIYDTNDYPFACMCNSAQYQNWKNTGSDPNKKVECSNTINTGIFNGNDIDYCDPSNIAASQ
ncbi:hypothetical protein HWI79_1521 [Cryptosporidium felis]|nr:hypothetical protein HWI79_1521 [Cryptosporidium felis]